MVRAGQNLHTLQGLDYADYELTKERRRMMLESGAEALLRSRNLRDWVRSFLVTLKHVYGGCPL